MQFKYFKSIVLYSASGELFNDFINYEVYDLYLSTYKNDAALNSNNYRIFIQLKITI